MLGPFAIASQCVFLQVYGYVATSVKWVNRGINTEKLAALPEQFVQDRGWDIGLPPMRQFIVGGT